MILILIILVSIGQLGLYIILDKMNVKYGRVMVFLAVLIGYLFVFPSFFYPELDPKDNCGLPILGINLAFWIIGGGAAILVHTIHYVIRKLGKRKSEYPDFPEVLDHQEIHQVN